MSDSLSEFRAKTRAMFAQVNEQIEAIGKEYVLRMSWSVIETTPGPNLQLPETEYIATGRLRAGFTISTAQVETASRWEGGPYTEHGDDTLAAIESYLAEGPLPPFLYLNNDVAYGYIVWHGIGRMPVARPWTAVAASPTNQEVAATEARLEVMARY